MKEEPAPIHFQLKLARRHQPRGRSSGIFITPVLGAPPLVITAHSCNPAALLPGVPTPASWEGASRKPDGQLEALWVHLSGSCLQYRNMTPNLVSGKGVTFSAAKARYHP